ncbi:hypothetical protein Tco_0384597 [Tanacetum coccineum]
MGDGGVLRVSLSDESVQMNGEVYCVVGAIGGIVGESTVGTITGMVVGIVPNKITQAVDVPTLSSDESEEIEMKEMVMTCISVDPF